MTIPLRGFLLAISITSAPFHAAAHVENQDAPKYTFPEFTFSPNKRLAVMVPVFQNDETKTETRQNQVVKLSSQKLITAINATPGYDRPLNHLKIAQPVWSADSSLLLWKVENRWSPSALVLIKIQDTGQVWQINLLQSAQDAILKRTKNASPEEYALARKSNNGNGSAYPDGFTVDVYTDQDDSTSLTLPLMVHANLSANPKEIPDHPNLDAYLDAEISDDGQFKVKQFTLGTRPDNWF